MATEPVKTIKVAADSELARLLTEAGDMPLILEKNGAAYRLEPLERSGEDIFAGYDPTRSRKPLPPLPGVGKIWTRRN
jgi:hypothetical protein